MSRPPQNTPPPAPPNSVRVWCGFKLPRMQAEEFNNLMGTVFIPATVKMQAAAGLDSYVPTVLTGLEGKPDSVPDETALVFWKTQQAYDNCRNKMLAGRAYKLTHSGVFDFENRRSLSSFPAPFNGSLEFDKPTYLFEKNAAWMHGTVRHFVAESPAGTDPAAFLAALSQKLAEIKQNLNQQLEGAIAFARKDYFVYWELAPPAAPAGTSEAPSGVPLLKEALAGSWSRAFTAEPANVTNNGLWDEWLGMTGVHAGSSLNVQFERQ
ncbi:hypothetical protein [Nitrososphaera sp.]|uniref:hypothetical protein n=1 Tax=Nitrososphaera sp. TaxID=1971748 RepID=UPI00307D92CA